MPFILNGRPLSPDAPFTHDDIQYPANWLRLATEEEKAAIGITWEPDPAPVDQRFWWDTGIPKDHAQLVEQWSAQTRATAGTLLAPTDWMVIREADNGTAMPDAVKARRQQIRDFSGLKCAAIEATSSTDELAAYVTSADYSRWEPQEPERARNADGTFMADDPTTPDVNEAYVSSGF